MICSKYFEKENARMCLEVHLVPHVVNGLNISQKGWLFILLVGGCIEVGD